MKTEETGYKDIPIAILTLKDADKMTKRRRELIAEWLQMQAENLRELGDNYAPTFRARYMKP